jgi:hypothetical protein
MRWYIRWPGAFYAEGPIALYDENKKKVETTSNRRARKLLREHLGFDRLPIGFECWPTDD